MRRPVVWTARAILAVLFALLVYLASTNTMHVNSRPWPFSTTHEMPIIAFVGYIVLSIVAVGLALVALGGLIFAAMDPD